MAVPKIVWEKSDKSSSLHDKKIIEALIQRLNVKIQNDPKLAKKAALIIESWLKERPKP